jgi:hypothetical protein
LERITFEQPDIIGEPADRLASDHPTLLDDDSQVVHARVGYKIASLYLEKFAKFN